MRAALEIEPYVDKAGEFRWRARARNGRIMADSGEGYATEQNLARAIDRFVRYIGTGEVHVLTLKR